MRILSAIVVVIALVAAVSVAYVQCGGGCGTPAAAGDCSSCQKAANCDGDCATCDCPKAANCDGDCATCDCPKAASCPKADCDGDCATCDCPKGGKCGDACAKVDGTVRYVRSTNKAVKVMDGEKGYLLRIGGECGGCPNAMMETLANLEKGDAVAATFQECPESGKLYLCTLKVVAQAETAEAAAPAPEPTAPVLGS